MSTVVHAPLGDDDGDGALAAALAASSAAFADEVSGAVSAALCGVAAHLHTTAKAVAVTTAAIVLLAVVALAWRALVWYAHSGGGADPELATEGNGPQRGKGGLMELVTPPSQQEMCAPPVRRSGQSDCDEKVHDQDPYGLEAEQAWRLFWTDLWVFTSELVRFFVFVFAVAAVMYAIWRMFVALLAAIRNAVANSHILTGDQVFDRHLVEWRMLQAVGMISLLVVALVASLAMIRGKARKEQARNLEQQEHPEVQAFGLEEYCCCCFTLPHCTCRQYCGGLWRCRLCNKCIGDCCGGLARACLDIVVKCCCTRCRFVCCLALAFMCYMRSWRTTEVQTAHWANSGKATRVASSACAPCTFFAWSCEMHAKWSLFSSVCSLCKVLRGKAIPTPMSLKTHCNNCCTCQEGGSCVFDGKDRSDKSCCCCCCCCDLCYIDACKQRTPCCDYAETMCCSHVKFGGRICAQMICMSPLCFCLPDELKMIMLCCVDG